ncbi:hypothetical protein FB45DRAFT_170779 [Roridomyces roridus]|uniref:Uncharacterized protein n=1 Tax=Roridomyces roridus TaxID=1738132 RepID=A0AAD7BF07_9AGAR|nr:hypothetical protein FB45DRAFT_170779 [Roridomyces roridus]
MEPEEDRDSADTVSPNADSSSLEGAMSPIRVGYIQVPFSAEPGDPYIDSLQYTPCSESPKSPNHSQDILKQPFLDEDDTGAGTVYLSASRRYNFSILLPALMTSLVTAGTASALLGWLISRRVKNAVGVDSVPFRHALVAVESPPTIFDSIIRPVETGNNDVATTMYGLALSSLMVHVVPLTMPFVLGVFAYLLAHLWLREQRRGRMNALPTPTQYGHLIALCGASGIRNVYDTARYLGLRKRPTASTTLIVAFCGTTLVLLVNYLLSVGDLWLHTTATTFSYAVQTPISSEVLPEMGSRINGTLCPAPAPYVLNGTVTGHSNCQHSQSGDRNGTWGTAALVNEGAAVLANGSFTSQIQVIDNLATLLPKTLPSGVRNLVFSTFAMEATCKPVSNCQKQAYLPGTDDNYLIFCNEFSPPFAVSGEASFESMLNQFDSTTSSLVFQSDMTGMPAAGVGPIGHVRGAGYALNATLNPAGVLVVLYWAGGMLSLPEDFAGWYNHTDTDTSVNYLFYLSSCVLDVWDVAVSYSASTNDGSAPSFSVVSSLKTHSDFNTSSALLAALDPAYSATLATQLTTTLQRSSSVSSEDFNTFLAGNLSQGVLAYAAPLTERVVSTSGEAFNFVTASRYPLGPLCLVLALAYGYSFVVLMAGFASFMLSSRELICQDDEGSQRISELNLLRLRLTSPRVIVSDRFLAEGAQSVFKSEDMFKEVLNPPRLAAGFQMRDGTMHEDEGQSVVVLRNVRRFAVDFVQETRGESRRQMKIEDL